MPLGALLVAMAAWRLPATAPGAMPIARDVRAPVSAFIAMSSPEDDGKKDNAASSADAAQVAIDSLENILGTVLTTVKANTDSWLNSGWSVKKRAGQWMPEVRPNSADIASRTAQLMAAADEDGAPTEAAVAEMGEVEGVVEDGSPNDSPIAAADASDAGAVLDISAARQSSLSAASPRELQGEFLSFLAEREGAGDFRTSWSGEVVFPSKQRLAQLVAQFSYAKLKQISAAARALARYVDDLETELEAADVEVVGLRTQLKEARGEAAAREAKVAELAARASEVESRLGATQAELDASARELSDAEARAEAAADELLQLGAAVREAEQRGASVEEKQAQAERLGIKLEEQLLEAERKALASERTQRQLASQLQQIERERALADERASSAAELAKAMEERSLAAEAAAEAKAAELEQLLSQREANALRLQEAVRALDGRLEEARQGGGGAGADALDDEAARLRAELRDVLDIEHLDGAAAAAGGADGSAAGPGESAVRRPPPLSRMRKAQLIAECEEYSIAADGTVAELRARLRAERKRRKAEGGATQQGEGPARDAVQITSDAPTTAASGAASGAPESTLT